MKLLLTVAMTLFALTAQAQSRPWTEEPYDFRGLSFGLATEAEARQAVPLHCRPGLTEKERICEEKGYVLVDTPADYSLHFLNGYLEGVLFQFKLEDYLRMTAVFASKYGEPHERKASVVTSRTGEKLDQETLHWTGPSIDIYMTKLSHNFDRSSATIGTNAFWKYIAEQSAKK